MCRKHSGVPHSVKGVINFLRSGVVYFPVRTAQLVWRSSDRNNRKQNMWEVLPDSYYSYEKPCQIECLIVFFIEHLNEDRLTLLFIASP